MNTGWHLRHVMAAPHRLAFFLALVGLLTSSAWWALVQWDRLGWGWMLWLLGGHLSNPVALVGAMLAWLGLSWVQVVFWRLLRSSGVPDRLHAMVIGVAGVLGAVALAGLVLSLLLDAQAIARLWLLTALWGFVVTTYVAVAHRMLPFFTANAVPMLHIWRPTWVMGALLGAVAMEVAFVWLEWLTGGEGGAHRGWMLSRGLLELAAGCVIVWLALAWGMVQSLKVRLLAMLHIGFAWLGLGTLQALTMGFLGPATGGGAANIRSFACRVGLAHGGRCVVVAGGVGRVGGAYAGLVWAPSSRWASRVKSTQ